MTLFRLKTSLLFATLSIVAMPAISADDNDVRINQIQVIGTHNSYHAGLAPNAGKLIQKTNPRAFADLDYQHPALSKQFDDGVRQIELDIFADTKGGRYSHPAIETMVVHAGMPADAPMAPPDVMAKPGFKVMHVQDIDQRSTCQPFVACLAEVHAWSKAHPGHAPIFILVETKQGSLKLSFPTVTAEPFTPAVFDALDRAIASVFARGDLITPDDVRGSYATLDAAVAHGNWPTLAKARGKVVFLLDQRNVETVYQQGHPGLRGRLVFTNATPGAADAAFTECNECNAERIDALVKRGYLVRTRTDDPATREAARNDTQRRDMALASGAQLLSTDYPAREPAASGYGVGFPNGVNARCNPVWKPDDCSDARIESSGYSLSASALH